MCPGLLLSLFSGDCVIRACSVYVYIRYTYIRHTYIIEGMHNTRLRFQTDKRIMEYVFRG